jgi:methylmalonyl-CoA mutase N-terminal domain/subunit
VQKALSAVRQTAATKNNLLPVLLDAAHARCTVGEIVNSLADIFGRYDGAAKW